MCEGEESTCKMPSRGCQGPPALPDLVADQVLWGGGFKMAAEQEEVSKTRSFVLHWLQHSHLLERKQPPGLSYLIKKSDLVTCRKRLRKS